MDLHHLRIFYTACREKSFTKASKKLFISQSAVSIQVKKLEEFLGVQLIERNSKKFKLTYIGKELYKMSIEIFDRISRMEHEVKKIVEQNKNKIIIGATHSIGEPMLPDIISKYNKQNPEIEFDVYVKNKESLFTHMYEGDIDIILLNTEPYVNNDIYSIEAEDYPFVLVGPNEVNDIEDLKKLYFLKREDESTSKYMEDLSKKFPFHIDKYMNVNGSIETIKKLIHSGIGYAVLPFYCVHTELNENEMKIFYTFDTETKLRIVLLKENREKDYISKFIIWLKNLKL